MIVHRCFTVIAGVSIFIIMGFSSCYSPRYVYSPSTQNIPQLTKKGEVIVGGYFATGGGSSRVGFTKSPGYNLGLDLHSGYALTDHFALMLNKYNRWEKNNGANDFNFGDSAVIKYRRGLTEVAAGYFTPLKKDSKSSFFQLFAGVAFGKFKIDDNSVTSGIHFSRFHYAPVTKIFIQPAIIVGSQKYITASFSSRFSEVFYHTVNTDYNVQELDNYLLNHLSSSPVFFWEPALHFSLAFKKIKGVKINFQSGFAVLINRRFVDYRTINVAFGITANNDLFKRKAKKRK